MKWDEPSTTRAECFRLQVQPNFSLAGVALYGTITYCDSSTVSNSEEDAPSAEDPLFIHREAHDSSRPSVIVVVFPTVHAILVASRQRPFIDRAQLINPSQRHRFSNSICYSSPIQASRPPSSARRPGSSFLVSTHYRPTSPSFDELVIRPPYTPSPHHPRCPPLAGVDQRHAQYKGRSARKQHDQPNQWPHPHPHPLLPRATHLRVPQLPPRPP